jgi:hypothetical protein
MKKKYFYRFSFFLLIGLFGLISFQVQARDVYVAPTGASSGDGTSASPVSYSRFADASGIMATHTSSQGDLNVHFAPGNYPVTAAVVLGTAANYRGYPIVFEKDLNSPSQGDVVFDGSGISNNNQFIATPAGTSSSQVSITFRNLVFKNFNKGTNSNPLIQSPAYTTIQLEGVIIDNCKNNVNYSLFYVNSNASLNINNSTFRNCVVSSANLDYNGLIRIEGGATARLRLTNSSFHNNDVRGQLIFLNTGESTIYNCTFSTNSFSGVATDNVRYAAIRTYNVTASGRVTIFNNTFYRSGGITFNDNSNRTYFLNNICVEPRRASVTQGIGSQVLRRNIFANSNSTAYYSEDLNSDFSFTETAFNAQFNTALSSSTVAGKQVHEIKDIANQSHLILTRGGTPANLATETGINLTVDQLGTNRPSGSAQIGLGAIDCKRYVIKKILPVTIFYNSVLGTLPASKTIDLASSLMDRPSGPITDVYELVGSATRPNGSISLAGSMLTFTPTSNLTVFGAKNPETFTYKVTSSDGLYSVTGEIIVQLVDQSRPPGYLDQTEFTTCFTTMTPVTFTSTYKFITGKSATSATIDGYTGPTIANTAERLYGFSIPLVGDLNGDGYPEIVATGVPDNSSGGGSMDLQYLYIHNGQTGEKILKFALPSAWGSRSVGYHDSPCHIALVDADRNGKGEIIVAYGSGGSSATGYPFTVQSFEVLTDGNKRITGLTSKWRNTSPWGSGNYTKPIPQVVDIDGDGIPEVVVYNRIYSALTGDLLLTIGTLGTDHFGLDTSVGNDGYINFSYIYDMDLDGKYDLVAGGKIYYDIDLVAGTYKTITMSGVADGRTGVADIDGDGRADVVSIDRTSASNVKISVWNPGFHLNPAGAPYLIAQVDYTIADSFTGNNSYVFIGDIDGKKQNYNGKDYRLPEIAFLAGSPTMSWLTNNNKQRYHPNVRSSMPTALSSGVEGVITAFTYDPSGAGTAADPKLKVSFLLEHSDRSINTGFTMFDFDNDGMQEICYRDEQTLRIIKASTPYVKLNESSGDVILFNKTARSYTGFEFPIIADIDNDASAEIVVMAHDQSGNHDYSFIYALGTDGDKFAPALPVWNQLMYDPFKIKSNLTTPVGPAPNRLDPVLYNYTKIVRNANGQVDPAKTIVNYNPYNNTLGQQALVAIKENDPEVGGLKSFEPIVFLTESYIVTSGANRPVIDGTTNANAKLVIWFGNKANARASISSNTPVTIYKNTIQGGIAPYKSVTLASFGIYNAIQPGQEVRGEIAVDELYGYYIIRLGDSSTPQSNVWRFGENERNLDGTAKNDPVTFTGTVPPSFRDCDWSDQTARASKFVLNNDAYTIQQFDSIKMDLVANDVFMPLQNSDLTTAVITQPVAGTIRITQDNQIVYTHTNQAALPNSVDTFSYSFSYNDPTAGLINRKALVSIFVLESAEQGFSACLNTNFAVKLKTHANVTYYWYQANGAEIVSPQNPKNQLNLTAIQTDTIFQIEPRVSSGTFMAPYPKGTLRVSVVVPDAGKNEKTLKWTGNVSSDWFNPNNWTDANDQPVTLSPTSCVNVILSENKNQYPFIDTTRVGFVHDIDLKNGAMIANTHRITYNAVSMEIKFDAAKLNRWIPLAAPLADMYAGDFTFRNTDGYPVRKASYLSLYQAANPDNSAETASAYAFTSPFSRIEEPLGLGKPFIFFVDGSRGSNFSLCFPASRDQYEYYYASQWGEKVPDANWSSVLGRPLSQGRFLTETASGIGADGSFNLSFANDLAGSEVILVTNPFNAYLKVDIFLNQNSSLLQPAYLLWDGLASSGFITMTNNRWTITNPSYITTNGAAIAGKLIPPFHSFFVVKQSAGASATSLYFNPQTMTTTIVPVP